MSAEAKVSLDRREYSRARYAVAAIGEFARHAGLPPRQAHRYLASHGAIEFLTEHYDAEHLLSFDEVVEDLVLVAAQAGGDIQ
ncbi:MAG: DUF3791 domain-containing protein [Bifidobacteriaceae bacterium]|jgi:hypothetical protein|nr:DUF3791 domain-containing protein [Bifidobacteriaceae bacterium]